MNWEFDSASMGWRRIGPTLGISSVPPFGAGNLLAWVQEQVLQVVPLRSRMQANQEGTQVLAPEGEIKADGSRPLASLPPGVPATTQGGSLALAAEVAFFTGAMVLKIPQIPLIPCPPGCTVGLAAAGRRWEFLLEGEGWTHEVPLDLAGPLADPTALQYAPPVRAEIPGPLGGLEVTCSWSWSPATSRLDLYVQGADGRPELASTCQGVTPDKRVGVSLRGLAPRGARVSFSGSDPWELSPWEQVGDLQVYGLQRDGAACALGQLMALGQTVTATLSAEGLGQASRRFTLSLGGTGARYQPRWDAPRQQIEVEQPEGAPEQWLFAPERPLPPRPTPGEPCSLLRLDRQGSSSSKLKVTIRNGPSRRGDLQRQALPLSYPDFDGAQEINLLWPKRGLGHGVFCLALPEGLTGSAWVPLPSDFTGPEVISWQGLVDRGWRLKASDPSGSDAERALFLLEHGFSLDPAFWPAAPFGGLAMTEDGQGWRVLSTPGCGVFPHPEGWRMEGSWYMVTARDSAGAERLVTAPLADPAELQFSLRPMPSCAIPGARPWLICPTGEGDPGAHSGPVLLLPEAGTGQPPRLLGFLSGLDGALSLLGGVLSLERKGGVRWLAHSDPVPAGWPEPFARAAAAAKESNRSRGEEDGVRWETSMDLTSGEVRISLRGPEQTMEGIYVLRRE